MSESRLPDYLDHRRQAVADAQSFVDGMAQADFMQDTALPALKTQLDALPPA